MPSHRGKLMVGIWRAYNHACTHDGYQASLGTARLQRCGHELDHARCRGAREGPMSLQGSVLAAPRFRTWLLHPIGPEVNSGCVGWTKHPFANPLAYWVRSLLPEALAQQVTGVNWRWGLLIGDGNCFPLPLWARFFAKAIEDLDPVSTGFPAMISAEDALR